MAKPKFNPVFYQNFTTNAKGELTYDDDTWNQINTRNEAIQKIERANQLKLEIQTETNNLLAQYAKEKQGFETKAKIGKAAQFVVDPRMWAKGAVGLFNMVTSNVQENIIGGGIAIGEQNTANNLYTQSKDLADQANKIVKTDRPQAEALLKQSQALFEEANKFAEGEATKRIMGADDELTGKEIFAKSALTGLEVASFLPVGGVAKGSFMLTKTVPAAVQGTKTVAVGNAITRALGLGDIYQVTKTGLQQGLQQEVQRTVIGQAVTSTYQAFITAGLIEMADDDGVNNYWGSLTTTAAGAFALTLGFGYAGRALGSAIPQKTGDTTPELPTTPTKAGNVRKAELERIQGIEADFLARTTEPAQDPIKQSLGAFDPNTTIPMVDLTETVKGNNIDFNPDSVMSINSARKAVDDLALLNGNEVGGKKLKINTDDPKYKEVYDTQIKPLIDKINAVDEVADVKIKSDEFQPKYIPTKPGKAPSFKKWLEFQIGWQDPITRPGTFNNKNELTDKEIKNVLKNWDTFDSNKIDGYEIVKYENGKFRLEEIDFVSVGEENGYILTTYLDKKVDKELQKLPTEFDTVDEAKEGLKKLLEFKLENKTAWDKAKLEIKKRDKEESLEFWKNEYELGLDKIIAENEGLKVQEQIKSGQQQIQFNKIPVEDVEMEVSKIYSTLENEGFNIVPEKVRHTPNIDKVDDKLAKGEQLKPEEFEQGMKEYVNSTGKTEVIDGVQEELSTRRKESTYYKRVTSANPELNNKAIVQYDVANMAEAQKYADDLVANNFDKAKEIAESIDASKIIDPRQVKVTETYTAKLLELGRYDEASDITANLSRALTKEGQSIASVRNSNIADPVAVIRKLNNERQTKFSKEMTAEVAKVKEQLNNVVIDKNAIIEILDNITCR